MTTLPILHPNDVAERLIGRSYLSYSAMSLYQRCPLAFKFKYVDGLPEETVSSSLAFGSALHAALEVHFQELMAGNEAPSHDELLDAFWWSWNSREGQTVHFNKGEDSTSIGLLADRMLRSFAVSDTSRPAGAILGVEEELRGPLGADLPDLLARIDLLAETPSEVVLSDFKTARSRWSREHALEASEQLLLYGELVRHLAPGKPLRLPFIVLTKTKEPSVETISVPYSQSRLDRTQAIYARVWHAIESQHIYPTPSPMNCSTCPYRVPCQEWAG